jgi:excisionase family DNA binding protein
VDRPPPLTVGEVAAELRCSEDEVRALIRDGELQTVACGVRPGLVPRFRLDDYLRRRRRRLEDAAGSSAAPSRTEIKTSGDE